MIEFLRRLLNLAKPYWLRLVLGIVFGFLGGLVDPLLVLMVPLVGRVVFAGTDLFHWTTERNILISARKFSASNGSSYFVKRRGKPHFSE